MSVHKAELNRMAADQTDVKLEVRIVFHDTNMAIRSRKACSEHGALSVVLYRLRSKVNRRLPIDPCVKSGCNAACNELMCGDQPQRCFPKSSSSPVGSMQQALHELFRLFLKRSFWFGPTA